MSLALMQFFIDFPIVHELMNWFSIFVFCIAGAEKALFRALKTKKDTPKYGLIYHAQLVGSASAKNKGKMARSLAAKASLATRVSVQSKSIQINRQINN